MRTTRDRVIAAVLLLVAVLGLGGGAVVGWRAAERHFHSLWSEAAKPSAVQRGFIVNGGGQGLFYNLGRTRATAPRDAVEAYERLVNLAGLPAQNVVPTELAFSGLLTSQDGENVLLDLLGDLSPSEPGHAVVHPSDQEAGP